MYVAWKSLLAASLLMTAPSFARDLPDVGEIGGVEGKVHQLTRLLAARAVDGSGKALGEVRDCVVDCNDARLVQVLIASGGVLGVGERVVAAPFAALRETRTDGVVVIDAVRAEVARPAAAAPETGWIALFRRCREPFLRDASLDDAQLAARGMTRASAWLGVEVADANGRILGAIEDLEIDAATGAIVRARLLAGGFLGVGGRRFTVAWTALRRVGDECTFVLDSAEARRDVATWSRALR